MDYYDILFAKKLNGEGGGDSTGIIVTEEILPNGGIVKHIEGQVISGTKQISSNGEFDVAAYKSVNVNVSGGGSSLSNPSGTFTVVNNSPQTMDFTYYKVIDGKLVEQYANIAPNSTETITAYMPYIDDGYLTGYAFYAGVWETVVSNTVNCVAEYGGAIATDPSLPISATITYE